MPYYDFECLDCKTITTIKLSVKDLENNTIVYCKKCNSINTKRYFQPVAIGINPSKEKEINGCGEHCQCFPKS